MSSDRLGQVRRTWLPILATWLMMATEGPVIAAFIARLPQPTVNLAAYGVAFAFALILEAPIIMLLSAATTLVHDYPSYSQLRRYMLGLNVLITGAALLFLWPPCFTAIAERGLDLPQAVTMRVYPAMAWLLPWPAAIGLRRFYQGVVLASGRTRQLAIGTAMRLASMALSCTLLARYSHLEGAAVGGAALACGVVTEAIAAYWLARPVVAELRASPAKPEAALNFRRFWHFYFPLMLTSLLALAVQPVVTFFVGRARLPLDSLAVLPVVTGITFIFRCFSLSFQDTALTVLRGQRGTLATLRSFARRLTVGLAVGAAVFAFTPLAGLWFSKVAGLPDALRDLATTALRIGALTPLFSVTLAYQTAAAIHAHKTRLITGASVIELATIAVVLLLGTFVWQWTGAVAATSALLSGRMASTFFLTFKVRLQGLRARREIAPELAGQQSAPL